MILVDAIAVHVVVRPRRVVDRGPGGLSLRVEWARGGIIFERMDGNSRVALSLQVRAPWLISLEPVATSRGVVAARPKAKLNFIRKLQEWRSTFVPWLWTNLNPVFNLVYTYFVQPCIYPV